MRKREAVSEASERWGALSVALAHAVRDRPEAALQTRASELRRHLWMQILEGELGKVPTKVQEQFARIFAATFASKVGIANGADGLTMSSAIGRCLPAPPVGETLRTLQAQLADEYGIA